MTYDPKKLTMLVGQAAHHLHTRLCDVATALIDTSGSGRMLFSNSALTYVDGTTLTLLARDYAASSTHELPHLFAHALEKHPLFLIVLDEIHVFVVVGCAQDEPHVHEFTERLRWLLQSTILAPAQVG